MKQALVLLFVFASMLIACDTKDKPLPADTGVTADPMLARLPKTLSSPLPVDPMNVTVHRLDNGLTVYLSENHETPRITSNIVVRAGGRHDPRDSTGMAHYLEHLLFKGSRKLGTLSWDAEKPHLARIRALYEELFTASAPEARKRIFKKIDDANIEAAKHAIPNELDQIYKMLGFKGVNAYTSNERTVYTLDFPKNRAQAWAIIESDRFLNPVFRLFQSELETVYEEKNRAMDSPGRVVHRAYLKAIYGDHPYATPILGTVEHLKNPSLEKLYAFYDKYYRPNNMAIALSGDFDSKEMLELVKRHFSVWKPKPQEEVKPFPLAGQKGVTRVNVEYEAEETLTIGWRTVANDHPDRNALRLMDMLVDNSATGIINLYLNQQQKVKSAGSYPSFKNDAGTWQMWGSPKKGQTLEEVEALLMEVVAKLKNGDFEQSDMDAVMTDMEVSRKSSMESNSWRTRTIVESFASYEEWEVTASRLEEMRKLTKADVLRVAAKYLSEIRVVVTRTKGKVEIPSIVKPEFTKIPIAPGRRSTFFEEIQALEAREIEPKWILEGKDYSVREGNWGKLVAVKNPVHDLFSLSFTFPRGWRHDAALRYAAGLWNLSGGGDLDAEAFKKKLYSLGSKMSFWCGEYESGARISGLEKHYDETLKLLKLRFAEPALKSDDLKKMIEVNLGRRADSKINPGSQQNALRQWAQRGKESSVLGDLSNEELKALDMDTLTALLGTVFDFKADVSYTGLRAADSVVQSFVEKGREYKEGFPRRPLRYVMPEKNRILFLHRDMVQSKVGMFTPDGTWDPGRWVDYAFYSNYIGGGMSSVLFQEVRESRALAYAVGGGYRYGRRKGDENIVVGGLGTQADKTLEGATLVRDLLANLPSDPARFEQTKESIVQGFRTNPLTYSQIPGSVYHWERAGIAGGDPRPARMMAATEYSLEKLERFARRLNNRKWIIYILGNKERVDLEALGKLGEVEMIELDSLYPY